MEYTIRDKGIHKIYELVGSLDIYSASKMKKEINAVLDEDDIDSYLWLFFASGKNSSQILKNNLNELNNEI